MLFCQGSDSSKTSRESIRKKYKERYKLKISDKYEKKRNFKKVTENSSLAKTKGKHTEFPPVYKKLDSLFVEFYGWVFSQYPKNGDPQADYDDWKEMDMPEDLMQEFAKAMIQTHFHTWEIHHKYIMAANKPNTNQVGRMMEMTRQGQGEWDEMPFPRAGWCYNVYIKNQIKKRMEPIWGLLAECKFIVVIDPLKYEYTDVDPTIPLVALRSFCAAKITNDIIGNYKYKKIAEIRLSMDKIDFDINSNYLILLDHEDFDDSHYRFSEMEVEHDHTTANYFKDKEYFRIQDGKILGLKGNLKSIGDGSVESFKMAIQEFLKANNIGVSNE